MGAKTTFDKKDLEDNGQIAKLDSKCTEITDQII